MRRRTLLATAALFVLGGCSSPGPTETVGDPAALLARTRGHLEAARSVHIAMVGADIPKDITAVLTARGDGTPTPAWSGRIKLQTRGVAVFIPVVAIKDDVWATLPWDGTMKKIDLAHYQAPNPARYFAKDTGLASLLSTVQHPVAAQSTRSGDVILRTITGTTPASVVHGILGIGATTGSYDLSFGIDDRDRLITLSIKGALYAGTTCRYDVTFSDYDKSVTITPPVAAH